MAERPGDKKSKQSSSKRKNDEGSDEDPELQGLSQVEREKVLMERYEKKEKEQKLQELKGGNKGAQTAQKKELLSQLKDKRMNAKDKKERMAAEENRDSDYNDSESEGEINDKRKRKNDDEDYVVDDKAMRGSRPEKKRKKSPSHEKKSPEKSQTVTMEVLEKIRLSRKNLALLVSHPHFEKTVKGAFVRVSSQTKQSAVDYLIAQIVDVKDYHKPYAVDDKETNKILILKHGQKETPMKICFISNGAFTGAEFTKWINKMQREAQKTPSIAEVELKQNEIAEGLNKRYSGNEIRENIEKRINEKIKKGEVLTSYEIDNLENKKYNKEKEHVTDPRNDVLKREIEKLGETIKKQKELLKSKGKGKGKPVKKEEDNILNEMDEMFGGDEEEEEKKPAKEVQNEKIQKSTKEAQKDYDRGKEVVEEEEEEKTEKEKMIEDMKKKGLSVAELYEEMKRDFIKAHKVDLSIDKLIDEWEIEGETVA